MFIGIVLTAFLEFDAVQLFIYGLPGSIIFDHAEQFIQFLYARGFGFQAVLHTVDLTAEGIQPGFKIVRRVEVLRCDEVDNLRILLDVANLCLITPRPGAAPGVVAAKQLRKVGPLRF